MSKISDVKAIQVFDSRGIPTVACEIKLDNGVFATAMVPSGASTGSKEALELRDNDSNYHGKGVLNAISNINNKLGPLLKGKESENQIEIDKILVDYDGTNDKSSMGANATLAISLAAAHVSAKNKNINLYEHFSRIYSDITGKRNKYSLPMPMFNILNGGEHADNNVDIQEFMIVPSGAKDFVQVMKWSMEIYHNLNKILLSKNYSTAVGDEGGFAPNLKSNEEAIELIIASIETTKLKPGEDVNIALDCAATEFFDGNNYVLDGDNQKYTSEEFTEYLDSLITKYPIISIEDAMDENDTDGWKMITKKLGKKCQLVGDDLFVTNKNIFQEGINEKLANSILIKFNQVGTITETIETINCARENNYKCIISHRSGETEDTSISDLAVGLGASQIKTGAPCRSDRIAKYNRLLWIEDKSNDILLNE